MIIIGAIFIMRYNWYILDPIFTFVISSYILIQSFRLIKEIANILIQGKPADVNIEKIKKEIEKLPYVENVHHIHVWTTDGVDLFFEGHVSLVKECDFELDRYIEEINKILEEKFLINHSTIQLEQKLCE
jgi:cobalt-zinc-cadmium efflux system protein